MRKRIGVMMLLVSFAASAWAAPAPITEEKPAPTPDAELTRKALNQTVDLVYDEQPLNLVLSTLTEQTKIPFVIDKRFLLNFELEPSEMTVSIKQKHVKLRDGLRSMLSQYGMTFVILGKTVLITSEEDAVNRQMEQRIDVEYNDEPLPKVLRDLSRRTATNIVLDPRAIKAKANEKLITLQLDDVSLETSVRLVAEVADLRAVRVGNVLFLTTDDRAERLKRDQDFTPPAPRGVEFGERILNLWERAKPLPIPQELPMNNP